MTTYDFTTSGVRAPTRTTPRMVSNAAIKVSSLTGAAQTISRPGERWEVELVWENLWGQHLRDVMAFFARLNGPEHRVNLDFDQSNNGAYGGTPVVNLASQTGSTINIRNASTGITDWAKAGDFVSFDNNIRMVTADTSSDGSGNVALPIWPAIRTSPGDGTALVTSSPTGTFILTTPVSVAFSARNTRPDGSAISSISLTFLEDVTA